MLSQTVMGRGSPNSRHIHDETSNGEFVEMVSLRYAGRCRPTRHFRQVGECDYSGRQVRKPYQPCVAYHGWQELGSSQAERTCFFTPSQSASVVTDIGTEGLNEERHSDEACDRTSEHSSETETQPRPLWIHLPEHPPPRVAIMSSYYVNNFIGLNGQNVSTHAAEGAGSVSIAPHIKSHEVFELERYPDGTVAFQSIAFPNVYMRASCDPKELSPGTKASGGGGTVNCQYVQRVARECGENEKFRIHPLGWNGEVAIEPLALPGRYLRLHPGEKKVNLQGNRGGYEKFYLLFVMDQ
ncbi:hypothetical protein BDZ91DRAFT_742614 [Kalaharituber pfeilii]|nr:hypothetical protein BDZ91DRAFT_742614 [Kalaharituber pfeilii]